MIEENRAVQKRGICFERISQHFFFFRKKIKLSMISPGFGRITFRNISVQFNVPFEPLNKLEIVLVFGFGEFLNLSLL